MNNNSEGIEQCAGRGCKNKAKVRLRINYIKKGGYFCDSCAKGLLKEGLAMIIDEGVLKW